MTFEEAIRKSIKAWYKDKNDFVRLANTRETETKYTKSYFRSIRTEMLGEQSKVNIELEDE